MSVPYYGDFAEDATVLIPFNTFTSDDPSASATITNLADADIKVHKDGNATEIVTDGATIAINFDGVTGNHLITIDTSVHADYSTSSDYLVRINGTTVDGATINAWVGIFSIENRFKDVNVVSEANIDFGAAKKTSLNAATTDLTAITSDKASYKATGFALASVVGALNNAAAAGEVTTADTLMQYLKQLINILIGDPGVVTFKAEAAPGDAISLSEVIRAIHADVTGLNGASGSAWVTATGFNTTTPDAAGTATGLHSTTDGLINGLSIPTVNEIWAKAMSDLATGAPSATASVLTAINYLYEALRNKTLTTATLITIKKDNGTTDLMKATISDDTTTFTKEKFVSG